MDIHNFERKYAREIEKLDEKTISKKNKQLILGFNEHLILDNISKPRLMRCMGTLRQLTGILQKDLDKATTGDIKKLISSIQQGDYSPWTKRTYKCIIRKFYKWQKGTKGKNKYPPIVDWINIRVSRSEIKLPSEGDLLVEEEIQKLIENADHPRDKALISVLWESGCRIGEIGNLCIKNVAFDKFGTVISVNGKTGSRKIRLISSTPYLSTWINNHPLRNNKESPLWISIGTVNHNKAIKYGNIRMMLSRLFKKADIRKRYNPHLFRHSRATFMANHLTEFQMNQYFGWIQGSGMPATYVHMSGREVDTAILEMNGIKDENKKEESKLKPRTCPRCDTINSANSKHCNKCAGVLDLKYAMELEEKQRETLSMRNDSDKLMNMLLKDQDVQELLMEKLRGLENGVGF